MAEHGDFLPHKEAELIEWLDNFIEKLQTNAMKWQISAAEAAETATLATDFKAKHAKCAGPDRSKTLVEEKTRQKWRLPPKSAQWVVKFLRPRAGGWSMRDKCRQYEETIRLHLAL